MKTSKLFRNGLLSVVLLAALGLSFMMGYYVCTSLTAVKDLRSFSKFKQLELALVYYHKAHGRFPATESIKNRDISLPVSWRVLLLPYTPSFSRSHNPEYDFSKKWDDVENLKLQNFGTMYETSARDSKNLDDHFANYLTIGPDEVWPWDRPMKAYLVVKGDDRFLLVEDPDSKIKWMEPRF
jgi:hypothetical protein